MNMTLKFLADFPRSKRSGAHALAFAILLVGGSALAQQEAAAPPPPAAAPAAPSGPLNIAAEDVRAPADHLGQTLSTINVAKWKAPQEVKGQTQADIASIQRNVRTTLPELLDAAKADPTKVAPAFAVYRNMSALYDVLLRVAETATLAGSQQDGATLEDERRRIEAARKSLGASILDAATAQDASIASLRSANTELTAKLAAVETPPKKIVVNDGPAATTTAPKKKKKPVTPAATPATPPAAPAAAK
jgi:hypothetical protein